MRVIKYKVWDKKPKRMWDATITPKDIFDLGCDEAKECLTDCVNPNEDFEYAFEDCELLQFTGLLDKNKKEIYEGDVIRISQGKKEATASVYEVVFEFASFQMRRHPEPKDDYPVTAFVTYGVQCAMNLRGIQDLAAIQSYLQVIGNRYENPELLNP